MPDDYSTTAVIIALVSLLFAGLTFILNWFQTKSQRLASESQFISDIQKEMDTDGDKILKLKTQEDCIIYVWSQLNVLDRLCFFEATGRLQDEIIKYFINYLQLGYRYYNWLIQVKYDEKFMLESFPYFLKTCKNHSVKEDKREILFIKIYDTLPVI